MRRRTLLFAIAASALLFASGCASKPTMKLNHAEVSGVQIGFPPTLGVLVTSVVDVYNPNSYDVAVRAVRGTIVIGERYSFPIQWTPGGEGVWLPADQTSQVRVPVVIPVQTAMQIVRDAYTSPMIPFRIVGRADVTATRTFKLEKDDYEVDERGQISRDQIDASMRGMVFGFPR